MSILIVLNEESLNRMLLSYFSFAAFYVFIARWPNVGRSLP